MAWHSSIFNTEFDISYSTSKLCHSQPRPYRCTPIVGKRSTPSQSLSHWDGATHCNGRGSPRRRCNKGTLYVLFGLVLGITPRTSKNKNEPPAARVYRQCNPKAIEVFFFRPTPLRFRQVVQHVRLHVAAMSELVNFAKMAAYL